MNQIEVGHNNHGNVAGRDVIVNPDMPMPCKNGDGWLSKADYERLPYCNSCIKNSHAKTCHKFHTYAIRCSFLLVVIYFSIVQQMPTFLSFLFTGNTPILKLIVQLLSSTVLSVFVLCCFVILFRLLANQYNKIVYPLHK